MRNEQVLLDCINAMMVFEDRFDAITSDMAEWVGERLAWHKLLPLAASLSDPTKPKCEALESIFNHTLLSNAIRERNYERQTRQLFQALSGAAIDFIPYKGPFWGQQLYPDYTWRHIGDIDLLLTIDDARRASAIIQKMGFRPDVMEGSEEEDFATRGAITLLSNPSEKGQFPVQLHWELMPSPRFLSKRYLPRDTFFEETSMSAWKGIPFRLPAPEVQFLYYILHATCQHQFMRFAHIMVLVHFIRAMKRLNWNRIHALAEHQQAQIPLYYGLLFIHAFWPLPEPALDLMGRIRPPLLNRIAAAVLKPVTTLSFSNARGKWRREIFRVAVS